MGHVGPAKRAEAVAMRMRGVSRQEVANHFGVHIGTLQSWMKKAGHTFAPARPTPDLADVAVGGDGVV